MWRSAGCLVQPVKPAKARSTPSIEENGGANRINPLINILREFSIQIFLKARGSPIPPSYANKLVSGSRLILTGWSQVNKAVISSHRWHVEQCVKL